MRLPAKVRHDLAAVNSYAQEIQKRMEAVNAYLEGLGYSTEDLRCGNGASLEEFEYGTGDIDAFETYLDTITPTKEGRP